MTPSGGRVYARLPVIAFWLAILGLCFLGMSRGLWTPDEPREAEMGREMYLAPTFIPQLNGHPFYEKPPVYYWTLAGAYALAGEPSSTAARCVSAAAGFATLLIVFFWASRHASHKVAYLAVFMLVTSVEFFRDTHWVLLDPLLMLFATMALWAAFEAVADTRRTRWLLLLYGSLILALWTKGLIGVVLPLAGIATFALLTRRERSVRIYAPFVGAAVLAVATGLCLFGFYLSGGSGAVYQLAWVNHVDRFIHPVHTGHSQPFYYYVQALPMAVLPWIVPFLGLFHKRFWKEILETEHPRLRLYLGCVAAGGFVLLSIPSTKRETYLLPLLPAVAILMALAFLGAIRVRPTEASRWSRFLYDRAQPLVLALWGLFVPVAVIVYTHSYWALYIAVLCMAGAAAWAGFRSGTKGNLLKAWEAHRLSAAIFCLAVIGLAMPIIDAQKDMAPFVRWMDAQLPTGRAVEAVGADETLCGIIPFVTGRRVVALSERQLTERIKASDQPLFLVDQDNAVPQVALAAAHYVLMREGRFGSHRTIRLWRYIGRKSTHAPPPPRNPAGLQPSGAGGRALR